MRARAYAAMGAAALNLGDPHQAKEYLLQAGALPCAPMTRADTSYNLAYAYELMRRFEPAIASYRAAAGVYASIAAHSEESRARQNLAWLLLAQGDLAGATLELRLTARMVAPASREQAQQLAMQAYAARTAGQSAEAVRICEDLLIPGHPGGTAWCRCFAAWLMADMAASEGRLDLARQFLSRAEREAEGAKDPALWNRLTALRNRLDKG